MNEPTPIWHCQAYANLRCISKIALTCPGDHQARIYAETLSGAIAALLEGPTVVGARERREIGNALGRASIGYRPKAQRFDRSAPPSAWVRMMPGKPLPALGCRAVPST